MKNWWVGTSGAKNIVFEAVDPEPTPESHPQYDYVTGPFEDKSRADDYASKHINLTGTFHEIPGMPSR